MAALYGPAERRDPGGCPVATLPRMSEHPRRASIVSGYFNPFHQGHLDLFEQARARTGYLVVVVNNDAQQLLKKGRIIQTEDVRTRIVAALRVVDDAIVARESGPGIDETFDEIRRALPGHRAGVLQRRGPVAGREPSRGGAGRRRAQPHRAGVRRGRGVQGRLQHPDPGRPRGRRLRLESGPGQRASRTSHSAPPSTAVKRSQRPTRPSTKNSVRLIRSWPASTARIANGGNPLNADRNTSAPAKNGRSCVRVRHFSRRAWAFGRLHALGAPSAQLSELAPR